MPVEASEKVSTLLVEASLVVGAKVLLEEASRVFNDSVPVEASLLAGNVVPFKASMIVPALVEASIVAGASVLLEKDSVLTCTKMSNEVSVVVSASVLVKAFDSVDVGSMETKYFLSSAYSTF